MEERPDEVEAYVKITDFRCPPEEVSRLIGLNASKHWTKGDLIYPQVSRRRGNSGWMLASGLSPERTAQDHIRALLERIAPLRDRFLRLPEGAAVAIYCVIYSTHGRPDISLDAGLVREIAALNAGIEFDLFSLPSE